MAAITDEKRKYIGLSLSKAFQVVYHYENEQVKTVMVHGVNNTEEAEDFFLDQFDEEKHDIPKVVSVIQVSL